MRTPRIRRGEIDGKKFRFMDYDMSSYMDLCATSYLEMVFDTKLTKVSKPFIDHRVVLTNHDTSGRGHAMLEANKSVPSDVESQLEKGPKWSLGSLRRVDPHEDLVRRAPSAMGSTQMHSHVGEESVKMDSGLRPRAPSSDLLHSAH